jgi:hypothetical protein
MTTQRQRDRVRQSTTATDFVPVSHLVRPTDACGAVKRLNGAPSLRCTLEAGHAGDHGIHYAGRLVVRWGR